MNILLASIENKADILAMAHAFHQEDGHPLANTGPVAIQALLEGSPHGEIYIMQNQGEIAGYFVLCFTMSVEFGGLVVILDDFYIKPTFRCQGIGAAILERMEELAKARQAVQIFLEVETANERALAFYKKYGFQKRLRHMLDKQI